MADQPNGAVTQAILFDLDDGVDEPVPYTLTARGRRLVDPTAPDLRVVPDADDQAAAGDVTGERAGGGARGQMDPGGSLARVHDELRDLDGPTHARVRALRRAGTATTSIQSRLDLDPLSLDVFMASPPVVEAGGVGTGRRGAPGPRHRTRDADVVTRDATALALLAAIGTVDQAGVAFTTNRIAVAAMLSGWLRHDLDVRAAAIRVVVRVADPGTADLVAAAWADRMGIGRDRVATVDWRTAPGPRDVQAMARVTDRALGIDLSARLAMWPDH